MGHTVVLMPGQGTQFVGMGRTLLARYEVAREVYAEASEALGRDVQKLSLEGPADELALTAWAQPAILTMSVAAWRAYVAETGGSMDAAAGHSLGEWSALVAAGALGLADAVRLVHLRGQLMQAAVPAGHGGMAAVIGVDAARAREFAAATRGDDVLDIAGFNGPKNTALSGHVAAIERLVEHAGEAGAVAVRLPVSAPFHCRLMAGAVEGLQGALAEVTFSKPEVPVVSTVAGLDGGIEVYSGGSALRDALVRQLTEPVQWVGAVERLLKGGVDQWISPGPSASIPGQIKRIKRRPVVTCFGEFDDRPEG